MEQKKQKKRTNTITTITACLLILAYKCCFAFFETHRWSRVVALFSAENKSPVIFKFAHIYMEESLVNRKLFCDNVTAQLKENLFPTAFFFSHKFGFTPIPYTNSCQTWQLTKILFSSILFGNNKFVSFRTVT